MKACNVTSCCHPHYSHVPVILTRVAKHDNVVLLVIHGGSPDLSEVFS